MQKQVPTVGRVVNYVMKDGTTRALHVTAAFGNEPNHVNGILMLDGGNDRFNDPAGDVPANESAPLMRWVTSAENIEEQNDEGRAITAGSWHWPVRS